VPIATVTDRYLAAYNADAAALGALPPTFQPRATETMDAIVRMIGDLVRNNAAYAADGHVLFSTEAFTDYGKLSGRPLDELIAGARVDVAPYKKDPRDFVLWKPSKPGEPEWESPWGPGRPGWHIECTAMIAESLGLPIDVHGGGIDLVFPHHENELAQGVCSGHGREYARYWLHNGFLNMAEEKMSKSIGNVALARDLLGQYPGEAIRWALLSGHYRQPLEWTGELIEQAKSALDRLYRTLDDSMRALEDEDPEPELDDRVLQALHDDLNTPAAMAALFQLSDELRSAIMRKDPRSAAAAQARLVGSANLMGFLTRAPQAWFQSGADDDLKARVEQLIAERAAARAAKNWPEADRIRAELSALNVEVMDGPAGATWRLKEQA
jgi:cysteinyl-tRNA synthetase